MVHATVSLAIEKLGEFIAKEVNIRIGVRDNVRWLQDELILLQYPVRSAESRQDNDQIRIWVNEVREVAHDAVTILRDFSDPKQEDAVPKQGVLDRLWGWVCMHKKEVKLYDIGKDIQSLKERIIAIKNMRTDYGIDSILATPSVQQKQRTLIRATAINNQIDVVGFKDDIKTLMAELDSQDPSLKVIFIHGMGGLGKTSLATKLYNSSNLRHFDTRAKVCVSNEYNIIDVLKRIIKSFKGPDHENYMLYMNERDLLDYLQKLLQDAGRYFALIDDIWDIKAWEQIKTAFPNLKNGSRIIITTRNKKVAQAVDHKCFVHQLRFLREDESWQLFCKSAEPTTPTMEKLGKEMVRKCGGLPLAIVVLSGLLSHNMSYEYWSKVKDHLWKHLKEGGSSQIEEILSLSYHNLSPQMRDCFLYLTRYPEDDVIDSMDLKLLWIAEQFISEADEGEGVALEDLGEDYLTELINRNLIQVESLELNGEASRCRVHDLVRELAIKMAMEQRLLGVFDSSKKHPNLIQYLKETHRHVINNGIGEYFKLVEHAYDALYLHSLALLKYNRVELKELKLMYTSFKNLRVLEMTDVDSDSNRIPDEIGDLVSLKFLGLIGSLGHENTIVIPASVGKLKKLQTLRGEGRYAFPREISELHELRYLHIRRISGSLNIGSHQKKLHTLIGIEYRQLLEIDVVNITNLHTLSVEIGEKGGYSLESIANLTNLQTFTLDSFISRIPTTKPLSSCNRLKSVTLCGPIEDPSDLSFLPDSLLYLKLLYSEFTEEDGISTLGNLPNLTALELYRVHDGHKIVRKIVWRSKAFPSLQILKLNFLSNLKELQVEDGALPCLKAFHTSYCNNLKKIPRHLEQLWIKDDDC